MKIKKLETVNHTCVVPMGSILMKLSQPKGLGRNFGQLKPDAEFTLVWLLSDCKENQVISIELFQDGDEVPSHYCYLSGFKVQHAQHTYYPFAKYFITSD